MAASSLYGAATARLLVTVGYPGKSEVQRGLSGLAGALAHFRSKVNADSHQAAERAVANTQSTLSKLQDVSQAQQIEGANFERAHQQRYIQERLGQFAQASQKLNTLTSKTIGQINTAQVGLYPDMMMKLFSGVATAGDEFQRLEKLADNFYKLGIDGEKELMNQLIDTNRARQSAIDLIEHELQLKKATIEVLRDPTKLKAAEEEYGVKAVAGGVAKGEKALQAEIKLAESRKAGIKADMMVTQDLLNLTKGLHTATVEGERKRKEAIKSTTKILNEQMKTVRDLIAQDTEWARGISQRVNVALQNFRGILQQSLVTLTLFYYKINQVVEGIKGFQQELMNAQSIFQTTNETLYGLSNQIVEFGTQFGVSYDNAAKGLYQFASAGLSAEDSMKVLNDTLKLSMAVQGDHNTISKLTTQVIFGFGLQMDEATAVTDKFAHAINKSLIEYQDLASAIKFSMPFFVSSGQSLDTLLGALQVLTNRALEAGIAGRGLRQALAEFTQHADDNAAAFRKLGVEILDDAGNMKELTNIAHQFNAALGEQATDMEVMMTLMEDLNVRGATAFIHLVQNADEFSSAVDDLANSAGSAHEMAMIQQQGLEAQLTRLRNAFLAPFLLTDEISNSVGVLNRFELVIQNIVSSLEGLIYEVGPEGDKVLTDFAINMREGVLQAMVQFGEILERVVNLVVAFSEEGMFNVSMLKLYFLPLSMIVSAFENLSPGIAKVLLALYVLNKTLPLTAILTKSLAAIEMMATVKSVTFAEGLMTVKRHGADPLTYSMTNLGKSIAVAAASMAIFLIPMLAMMKMSSGWTNAARAIFTLVAAFIALGIAMTFGTSWITTGAALAAAGASLGAWMGAFSPDTAAIDMGSWSTDLNTMPTNVVTTGQHSYNPDEIYVSKLTYSESNMNQQYQTAASYQAGVSP